MSPREKNLLILFASAGFLVLNLLAYNFYSSKRAAIERSVKEAQLKLDTAEMFRASREQVVDEMEWLAEREPKPAVNQDVQTTLQQLCEREAGSAGLTINSQKPLPTDSTEGRHFHRAKIQISLTGTEDALYRWFDRVNVPEQFRAATQIKLSPDKKDDTKIDCVATVEQWFVPLPPA